MAELLLKYREFKAALTAGKWFTVLRIVGELAVLIAALGEPSKAFAANPGQTDELRACVAECDVLCAAPPVMGAEDAGKLSASSVLSLGKAVNGLTTELFLAA